MGPIDAISDERFSKTTISLNRVVKTATKDEVENPIYDISRRREMSP